MPLTRLTIIAHDPKYDDTAFWNDEPTQHRRVVFLDDTSCMRLSIGSALAEPMLDTERVILDRVVPAEMFLELLSSLPPHFTGDILRVDKRGAGFLSATGRGGDRVLYALDPDDVYFYFATHDLLKNVLLEKTA